MDTTEGVLMRSHKLAVLGFEGVALLQSDGTIRGDRDQLSVQVLRDKAWVGLDQLRLRMTRLGVAPAWRCKFRSGDGDVALEYSAHNAGSVAVIIVDVLNESSVPVGLRWRGLGLVAPGLRESRGATAAGRQWIASVAVSDDAHMTVLHRGAARLVIAMGTGLTPPTSALTFDVADGLRGWERLIDQCAQLDHPESPRVESWRAMLADVAVYASIPPRQLELSRVCRELQLAAQLNIEPVTTLYGDDLLTRQLPDGSWLPDREISADRQIDSTVDALSAMAIALRSINGERHDVLVKSLAVAISNAALWLERNAPTRTRLRRRVQSVSAAVVASLTQAGLALSDCASSQELVTAGREMTGLANELSSSIADSAMVAFSESPVDGWILTDVGSRTITLFADHRQVGNQNVSIGPIVTPLGTVTAAVRWHDERAALLWDISGTEEPVELRTGLDPTWHRVVDAQSGSFVGQTLV